jgi:hypothetical protein
MGCQHFSWCRNESFNLGKNRGRSIWNWRHVRTPSWLLLLCTAAWSCGAVFAVYLVLTSIL